MRENLQTTPVPDLSGTCAAIRAGLFAKKPNEIKHVPDVPDFWPTPFACAHAHASAQTTAQIQPPHGYIPRHIRHIRHIVVFKRKKDEKPGTQTGTNFFKPAHAFFGAKT